MPNADIVDVTEGIKTEIEGHDWGHEMCVIRSYANVREELKELDEIRIDVVPWASTPEMDSVGSIDTACEVDIYIRKKFKKSEQDDEGVIPNEDIDPMMKLVTDIYEFFMPSQNQDAALMRSGRQLTDLPEARWTETRLVSHYLRRELKERMFAGWIRLTYSLHKTIAIT